MCIHVCDGVWVSRGDKMEEVSLFLAATRSNQGDIGKMQLGRHQEGDLSISVGIASETGKE